MPADCIRILDVPSSEKLGMQVPAPFEYERATSVEHAIGLLERLGSSSRLVAGGHILLPMMKLRLANLEYLIDINDLHDELGTSTSKPRRSGSVPWHTTVSFSTRTGSRRPSRSFVTPSGSSPIPSFAR